MIKPRGAVDPQTGVTRPASRLDAFEGFLGNFINSLGQGFAASGHGPGAFARGFGAAVAAPYQTAVGQYQLQQQAQANQAEIAQKQAQTQLAQAQAEQMKNVVQTPYAPMSQALAAKVFPAAIAAQGRTGAAEISGGARVEAARIGQGMMVDVPQDLQDTFGVPAPLPLKQLNTLESITNRPLTIVQGLEGPILFNKQTSQQTSLGVGNPRLATPKPEADPNVPGGVKWVSGAQAIAGGMQAPSSAAVTVPKKVIQDFTSGGAAKTLNAFNTATEHLKLLSQLGDALQNRSTPLINKFGNLYVTSTGEAAPTNFDTAKNAVAGEIAKTFKGNATEGEIAAINTIINNAQSPAQLKGAINTALDLMGSKKQALQTQYQQGLSGQPAFGGAGTTSDSSRPAQSLMP